MRLIIDSRYQHVRAIAALWFVKRWVRATFQRPERIEINGLKFSERKA